MKNIDSIKAEGQYETTRLVKILTVAGGLRSNTGNSARARDYDNNYDQRTR